jgi:hypothetical protein
MRNAVTCTPCGDGSLGHTPTRAAAHSPLDGPTVGWLPGKSRCLKQAGLPCCTCIGQREWRRYPAGGCVQGKPAAVFPDEVDSGYIPRSIKAQEVRWYGGSSKQLEHIAAALRRTSRRE